MIGDIDGDGDLEVCVATESGLLSIYHHDGSPLNGWPINLGEPLHYAPTPTIFDIDEDGDLEIFLPAGIRVYALHHDGISVAGWPVRMGQYTTSNSTIAAGDIDGDGDYDWNSTSTGSCRTLKRCLLMRSIKK